MDLTPVLARLEAGHDRILGELIDFAKKNPGQANYGSSAAAFQIATDEIQSLGAKHPTKTAPERQSTCASATQLEDLVRLVTIAMPRGGSVDPVLATQILGALPGYSDFRTSVKHASCRRD